MYRLFTAFIITLIAMPVLAQRANFDSERMDRDLRIMERIYTDLQRQAAGVMGASNARTVHGSYFSGYGIIFNVNETFSSNFLFSSAYPARTTSVAGQSGTMTPSTVFGTTTRSRVEGVEMKEISTDSLSYIAYERNKDVIRDFFANYIDAIGQLNDDDKVSVVISNRGNPIVYTTVGSNSRLTSSSFNPLRAEVQIKDVVAYRTGSINESTFIDRIVFSELNSQASNQKELQVMQGIFESALRDTKDSRVRLSRDVQGVALTNFGAMFNLDVTFAINQFFGIDSNQINAIEVLKTGENSGHIELLLKDSTKVLIPTMQTITASGTSTGRYSNATKTRTIESAVASIKAATIEGDYVSFAESMTILIEQVSDLVLDYGRTLRSLKPDEKVLVSINQLITQSDPDVPKRVEIQIDVQTLRDLDRGSITRGQAKQKLVVRKF